MNWMGGMKSWVAIAAVGAALMGCNTQTTLHLKDGSTATGWVHRERAGVVRVVDDRGAEKVVYTEGIDRADLPGKPPQTVGATLAVLGLVQGALGAGLLAHVASCEDRGLFSLCGIVEGTIGAPLAASGLAHIITGTAMIVWGSNTEDEAEEDLQGADVEVAVGPGGVRLSF